MRIECKHSLLSPVCRTTTHLSCVKFASKTEKVVSVSPSFWLSQVLLRLSPRLSFRHDFLRLLRLGLGFGSGLALAFGLALGLRLGLGLGSGLGLRLVLGSS